MGFQQEKQFVQSFFNAIQNSCENTIVEIIEQFVSENFKFRGKQLL